MYVIFLYVYIYTHMGDLSLYSRPKDSCSLHGTGLQRNLGEIIKPGTKRSPSHVMTMLTCAGPLLRCALCEQLL